MKDLFSPGNLITVSGAVLTVIGAIAYATGAANLSVPTIFYGFPIFIGGLALKTSELPPAKRLIPAKEFKETRENGTPELAKLVGDVTRWRYGQKAHLESSLEVLNLWDEDTPPQLIEIEELNTQSGYGVRLRFQIGGVAMKRWQEKEARLSRFFAKDLEAKIIPFSQEELDLMLQPTTTEIDSKIENESS